ncbi:mannose-1-phosphate guanylyltransferase/mannose-6-phosphate isomerase [Magnetovibrio sp. PR-2]|uniref:mannose-1-phosphate guanylyltransferase/mannose-6-phosphate isomerase n=1 Tax=Magnetovibrio sp. PR-2 TaxID=3120356 RepID=UPI002FCE3C36
MSTIVPVILSGGSGTRLWPMSRTLYPKQLQSLYSDQSMLVETAARVSGDNFGSPVVICNAEHRFIIAEQLHKAGIKPASIILEPVGRNTAPAAAVAAEVLMQDDPDALMLLMPSDHLITKPDVFLKACAQARAAAEDKALVTFGIVPKAPETGFGYIQKGSDLDAYEGCFAVDRFVEKPDLATAEQYLQQGDYYWNSGIFLFKARDYLEELSRSHPDMVDLCKTAVVEGQRDMDFFRLAENHFHDIKGDSIDYAVMEKTEHAAIVPVDMGWDDVGSWSALWAVGDKDEDGNILLGDVIAHNVQRSYVRSSGQLVASLGVRDTIVVATDDVVLVADKDHAQNVKNIVSQLQDEGRDEHMLHKRVYRPWGWYQCMEQANHFQVKQLSIKPGGILSLQSHKHRSEHWVVVSGQASVVRDEEEITLDVNQSTYIPANVKHRLENKADQPLRIIEVQTGSYLGEDDIERYEDIYGRCM